MKIIYDTDLSRPTTTYEDVVVKRTDVGDDTKTYKLTPAGRKFAELVFALVGPVTEITFQKIGNIITIDTGLGLKLSPAEYFTLDIVVENFENTIPKAFQALSPDSLRQFAQNEAGMIWWDTTNQGSAP